MKSEIQTGIQSGDVSNAYYTLQVDRCELGDDPDTWRLAVTQCIPDGLSTTKQQLHFERYFDSQEGADQYGHTWASVQRAPVIHAAAITQLRWRLHSYGFDVSTYSDEQVSSALREAAAATMESRVNLFVRAFQQLRQVQPNDV